MKLILCKIILSAIFLQMEAKIFMNEQWSGPILKLPKLKYQWKERMVPIIKTINQTLDHFGQGTSQTFEQRYAENLQFYNGTGPMVVFISGEESLYNTISYLYTGLAFDVANQIGAALYMLEHRYYGTSHPNGDYNSRTYLRVNQALADVISFVQKKKSADSGLGQVVLFGGSYTGSLAAWARETYPDVIDAAVSASGIFDIKINGYEYFEVVQKSIEVYPGCITVVKDGSQTIQKKLRTISGILEVQKEFQISIPILKTLVSPAYKKYLINTLVLVPISMTVQYDQIDQKISDMCTYLTINESSSNSQRLANYFNIFYNTSSFNSSEYPSSSTDATSWNYHICVELGNFVTTSSKNQPFSNAQPLWYFYYNCAAYMNFLSPMLLQYYNPKLSKTYGGKNMNVTKVIFTVGTVDPWNGIGLKNDLNAEAPVLSIEGSSHCAILAPSSMVNSTALTNARNKVTTLIKKWLQK